jgi:hypothetical protein
MQEPIGFEWQGPGACGTYSLQHALLCLAVPITQRDAQRAARVTRKSLPLFGTNEQKMQRAIRERSCKPVVRSLYHRRVARLEIDRLLDVGCPVILSVRGGDHWVVVAGRRREEYVVIDSNDKVLVRAYDWEQLADWMIVGSDDGEYYFIGVRPRDERWLRHSIVHRFGTVWGMLADEGLRTHWGYYLEDLLEAFDCPPSPRGLPARRFFEEHGELLFQVSCHYYYQAKPTKMRWELSNYRKVAIAHELTVSRERVPRAIASLSSALTCIACIES